MEFRFNMPVELLFGTGVIKENTGKFRLGKKALIVTGKNSARLSGALTDVVFALSEENIEYCLFDKVGSNPDLDTVSSGSEYGRNENVDFVIAIGGGSPMDAAKAISALITNDIEPVELIGRVPENSLMPMIAIPTTSGTGSELTPYSILTVPSMRTKKNFYSPTSFPRISFADPSYTYSLPYNITVDTAFDAFSHLLESYLSVRSTALNDSIITEGMKAFAKCMKPLVEGNIDDEIRELLMYASCLAGIAITHTGTTVVHAMGYSLTYFRGYSHGRANAMLMGEYLRFNEQVSKDKIEQVLDILGFEGIDEFDEYFSSGDYKKPLLTEEECKTFTELAMDQGSVRLNPRTVKDKDIKDMYHRVFGGTK